MPVRVVAPTLRGYQRSWLVADAVAGLTLAAIAIPEQMATARLVNLPAVAGLYAFVAGSVVFGLLGRSRTMSVGADSTIAPVMAAGVSAVVAAGTPRYGDLISLLAVMVGVVVVAIGLVRLGWIAEFLSTPVVTGVLAGVGVEIVVRQLPTILGLPGGGVSPLQRLGKVADQIGHSNGWAVGIAVGVFAIIVIAERIDRRLPAALVASVISVGAVAALSLKARGVQTLGVIRGGLPSFAVPSGAFTDSRRLLGPAVIVAFLCVAQTAATVRASAADTASRDDFNRDLVAIGAASVLSGLAGSFAVNSSPPRSVVAAGSGARSQLAGMVAAAVTLLVVLSATGLLKDLPSAALAAILVFIACRLFHVGELRKILRFDRTEFLLAMVALVAVALVGIETGIVVAMVLALAERTYRSSRPRGVVLGRELGTVHWVPTDVGVPTEQLPGVLVYLLYGPLWYANASFVAGSVRDLVGSINPSVHALVLDVNGVSDIDYTCAQALGDLATQLKGLGVTTLIARSSHLLHHDLKHSGILADIGPENLFASVEEAVVSLGGRK